jgi:phospholipid/cholesterol/gamma-HCH transport system substrate-binding protein
VRSFGNSLTGFNSFLNELSYKPKGKESYLFYLPWLNHDFNASFNTEDAGGPILRGLVLISCTGADLGYGAAKNQALQGQPFLETLLQTLQIPRKTEITVPFKTSEPGNTCVYTANPNASE